MANRHKIFDYDKISVFFKHTDYHGCVHAYNYLEWMSFTREAYFQQLVPNFLEVCNRNIKMVTAFVEFRLEGDAAFGDRLMVQIYAEHVKRLSFDVIFEFRKQNSNRLIGRGRQRLTFLDGATGRPARIPEELKKVVLEYERREDAGSLTQS